MMQLANGSGISSQVGHTSVTDCLQLKQISTSRGLRNSAAADSVNAIFFDGKPDWDKTGIIQLVFRDHVERNPFNPRRWVAREQMFSLQQSIAATGVHKPLDVCRNPDNDNGLILSGHRRFWAIETLQLDLVPIKLDPRGALTQLQMLEALIRYNQGQEKPAPIDEAEAVLGYMKAGTFNNEETALRLGISEFVVFRYMKLLTLPASIKDMVNRGKLTETVGLHLTGLNERPQQQLTLAERAVREEMTGDAVRRTVTSLKGNRSILDAVRSTKRVERNLEPKVLVVNLGTPETPIEIAISTPGDRRLNKEVARELITRALNSVPIEMESHHLKAEPLHSPVPSSMTERTPIVSSENGNGTAAVISPAVPELTSEPSSSTAMIIAEPGIKVVKTPRGRLRAAVADSIDAKFFDGLPNWSETGVVQLIYASVLSPHPLNPRKLLSREKLDELMTGIRAVGIHTPLEISKHPTNAEGAYLMSGHRRLYSALQLSVGLVPCYLDPRGVLSDKDARERLLQANEGEIPPSPIDRAISYHAYLLLCHFDKRRACDRLQIDPATLDKSLRLLALPADVQQWVNEGLINESVAVAIVECPSGPNAMKKLARQAIDRKLTAAQVKEQIKTYGVSAADLAQANSAENDTERHWVMHDGFRAHIQLIAPGQKLSHAAVAGALKDSLTKVGELQGDVDIGAPAILGIAKTTRAVAKSTGLESTSVPLTPLIPRNAEQVLAFMFKYCPNLLTSHPNPTISASVSAALTRQLQQKELETFGLTLTSHTAARCCTWLGIKDRKPSTVSVIELATYLASQVEFLRSQPSNKKILRSDEIDRNHVDSDLVSVNVQSQYGLVVAKAKIIEETVRTGLQAVTDLEKTTVVSTPLSPVLVPTSELPALGVMVTPEFNRFFRAWARERGGSSENAPTAEGGGSVDLREVRMFLLQSASNLLRLCGGKFTSKIGPVQLLRAKVYAPFDYKGQKFTSATRLQQSLSEAISHINQRIG